MGNVGFIHLDIVINIEWDTLGTLEVTSFLLPQYNMLQCSSGICPTFNMCISVTNEEV